MTVKGTYFQGIKHLTARDTSVEVPAETRQRALGIFPKKRPLSLFSLIPATAAMVRKGRSTRKFSYERGDDVVQLELSDGVSSCQLSGFVHGIADGPVVLNGEEISFETEIEDGTFVFDSVPHGRYILGIPREGDTCWVNDLQLTPLTEG